MKKTRILSLILSSCMIFTLAGCQQSYSGPINGKDHEEGVVEKDTDEEGDTERPEALPTPTDLAPLDEGGNDDAPQPAAPSQKNYTADWDGIWLPDDYSSFKGTLSIEASSTGDLQLTFTSGDKTATITGKETDYDEASYSYGTYVTASLENESNTSIRYSKEPDECYITYDGKDPMGGEEYVWIVFYAYGEGYHTAPEGYEDADQYGKFSRKDPMDSDYFYAETDDFIVEYRKSDSMYNGTQSCTCESYTLSSYDVNGCIEGWKKTKYIFEDENNAIECYNYQSSNYGGDYYKYYRDGSIVYMWYKASGYTKLNMVSKWYLNTHYNVTSSDEDYLIYSYFSKPITLAEYFMSLDDILYYNSVLGSHYCLDSKDAYLDVYISKEELSLYPYCDGNDYYRGNGYSVVKIDGMKVYTVYNDEYYNWLSSNNYEKAVVIQVYEFGTEKATVTEYQFVVNDITNSGITLDNFMSKTPDKVISHDFDMTRLRVGIN